MNFIVVSFIKKMSVKVSAVAVAICGLKFDSKFYWFSTDQKQINNSFVKVVC